MVDRFYRTRAWPVPNITVILTVAASLGTVVTHASWYLSQVGIMAPFGVHGCNSHDRVLQCAMGCSWY